MIPYATPYRVNQVALDVTTAGNDVELENAIVSKTPTDGALVRATMVTRQGAKALFVIRRHHEVLPFGAVVSLADEQTSSIVGDAGSCICRACLLKARCTPSGDRKAAKAAALNIVCVSRTITPAPASIHRR